MWNFAQECNIHPPMTINHLVFTHKCTCFMCPYTQNDHIYICVKDVYEYMYNIQAFMH